MFKQIQIIKIYQKLGQAMCPHHSNHSSKSTVSKWEGPFPKKIFSFAENDWKT